jgi:FeS assembly SUF system regulator
MIRLGKLTDYGLVLMTCMAREDPQTQHTARSLALESKLPLSTVSKLLKTLLQGGLLISRRGIKGGYVLAREAGAISVAEIIVALEGPIALTECSGEAVGLCELEEHCVLRNNQRAISQAVRGALENIMLSDLVHPLPLIAIKNSRGQLVPSIGVLAGRIQ